MIVAICLALFTLAVVNAHGGCTVKERLAFTPQLPGSQAYACVQGGYAAGFLASNSSAVYDTTMACVHEPPMNYTHGCAECASTYSECQFNACGSDCADDTSAACVNCLNSTQPLCQTGFTNCSMAGGNTTTTTLLVGSVNLNQAASDLNAQIVGASVGVLCGFTALLVLISMTGKLG